MSIMYSKKQNNQLKFMEILRSLSRPAVWGQSGKSTDINEQVLSIEKHQNN